MDVLKKSNNHKFMFWSESLSSCMGGVHPEPTAGPQRDRQPSHTHSYLKVTWRNQLTWRACYWSLGGSRVPGENPHMNRENMKTPHRIFREHDTSDLNPTDNFLGCAGEGFTLWSDSPIIK